MNLAKIYEDLAALSAKPYDPIEFPFAFALATDNPPATFNKSNHPGGALVNQMFLENLTELYDELTPRQERQQIIETNCENGLA